MNLLFIVIGCMIVGLLAGSIYDACNNPSTDEDAMVDADDEQLSLFDEES